jgi:hypothetical protein
MSSERVVDFCAGGISGRDDYNHAVACHQNKRDNESSCAIKHRGAKRLFLAGMGVFKRTRGLSTSYAISISDVDRIGKHVISAWEGRSGIIKEEWIEQLSNHDITPVEVFAVLSVDMPPPGKG